MIGYTCKYVPTELFEAMGVETKRIDPNVTNYDKAETMMHANLCSYIKGVLEDVMSSNYEGVVLTNCCDSTKRLYDTLRKEFPDKFVYILDLPRKNTEDAVKLYENSIMSIIKHYEEFSGRVFDKDKLKQILQSKNKKKEYKRGRINIGIVGARCNDGIMDVIKKSGAEIAFNISCTGDERIFDIKNYDNLLNEYVKELFAKIPCVRMVDLNKRKEFMTRSKDVVDGIIYHTVKFCDIYSYDYVEIKNKLNIPILKVETDYTKQCEGQIKTRVEAFIESLNVIKSDEKSDCEKKYPDCGRSSMCVGCDADREKNIIESRNRYNAIKSDVEKEKSLGEVKSNMSSDKKIYVLGIDSGSTSTNAVILDGKRKIVASDVVRTGAKSSESARRALENVLRKAGIDKEELSLIVSTGYGRVSIDFADKNVTEISCHGKGAHYLNPDVRTIIDIGGQDSKAIRLNDKGEVIDFVMNDKCAAGTGRFLEMMARTLEIDIKDMGPISLNWKEDIKISSMCSVFAESEVISLIAENKEKPDIIHALNNSIAGKTNALLGRVGRESKFMMSGGVAQNIGVVKALEEKIGEELFIPEEPEIVGAIGAAIYGLESINN